MEEKTYQDRLLKVIPGGAHTYSRGYDQYPQNAPQILKKGVGAYVYACAGEGSCAKCECHYENKNVFLDY